MTTTIGPMLRCPAPSRPAAFRRPRLLIVGCGDIGQRVVRQLQGRYRVRALTSQADRVTELRALGVTPLRGDLDQAHSLRRLAGLAARTLHLAPPPARGPKDTRTRQLLAALSRVSMCDRSGASRLVYASTSGVYGDAGGAWIDETCAPAPRSDRGVRRVDAEQQVRRWALSTGANACILRIPGIYASDRPGGHPRERLGRGTAVLGTEDDVYTNHIHADDLARCCIAALHRGRPMRVVHTCDDTEMKMGDYFDLAADLCGLPRPPRITWAEATTQLAPMLLSFMSESRRLHNQRLKHELRVVLRYPTVREGLLA